GGAFDQERGLVVGVVGPAQVDLTGAGGGGQPRGRRRDRDGTAAPLPHRPVVGDAHLLHARAQGLGGGGGGGRVGAEAEAAAGAAHPLVQHDHRRAPHRVAQGDGEGGGGLAEGGGEGGGAGGTHLHHVDQVLLQRPAGG